MTTEEAIKTIEVAIAEVECDYPMEYAVAFEKAIAALRAQQKTKWISVKERLPEDDLPKDSHRKMIRCLVATDKGTVKQCVRQGYDKKIDGEWKICPWEWNKDLYAKPTHWMLLPSPPR